MQKLLMKSLSALVLLICTTAAFATPNYSVTVGSISAGLNRVKALRGVGPATDIAVINYTEGTVFIYYPNNITLTRHTSARIKDQYYDGDTTVILLAATGQECWRATNIKPLDTISVYQCEFDYNTNRPKYNIYVTH
jgi:hypothetical protein